MKKHTFIIIILFIQFTGIKAQAKQDTIMSIDSANELLQKSALEGTGLQSIDSSTAKILINTYLYYSTLEKYRGIATDYLSKVTFMIDEYFPNSTLLQKRLYIKTKELSAKDIIYLEKNIKVAFPELQKYTAINCVEYILKNSDKLSERLKSENVIKVLYGTPEWNYYDGLFHLMNNYAPENEWKDKALQFKLIFINTPEYINYESNKRWY